MSALRAELLGKASSGCVIDDRVPRALWTAALFAAMTSIGVALSMLGPTFLELSNQLGVPLATASTLFSWRAFGYLWGALASGELLDREMNAAAFLLLPLLCASVGAFALPYLHSYAVACPLLFFQGLSMGMLDVGGNVLLLTLWRSSKYLNGLMHALHFFFGLGAFIAPLIVSFGLALGYKATSAWTCVGVALLPACMVFLVLIFTQQPKVEPEADMAANRIVLLSGAFLFVYVGIEVAFGGYIDAFATRQLLSTDADAAQLTSIFWGLLCMGRLVASVATPYVHHGRYLAAHLVLAILSIAALGMATGNSVEPPSVGSLDFLWGVTVPTALFGFALAPLFPGVMLLTEELLGREVSGRAASHMVVCASVGEMCCPLVVGLLFVASPMNFCWAQLFLCFVATVIFLQYGSRVFASKAA